MKLKPTQSIFTTAVFFVVLVVSILVVGIVGHAQDTATQSTPMSTADAEIAKKLGAMIVPSIKFTDTPFSLAIDYLRTRSEELDTETKDPAKKGVNILIIGEEMNDVLITLNLKNIPMLEALRYTSSLVQGKMSIQRSVVVIEPGKGVGGGGMPELTVEQRKAGIEILKKKLSSIQIPLIDLKNTPFRDVLAFLQQRSVELDLGEDDPDKKGINIVLEDGGHVNVEVTLKLRNLSLGDALFFSCAKAGLEYRVEPSAVVISSP